MQHLGGEEYKCCREGEVKKEREEDGGRKKEGGREMVGRGSIS